VREAARAKPLPGRGVNLYVPVATASRFLTRRFGVVGGLGFVAALASVEGGEIVKALLERDVDVSTTAEEFAVEGNARGLRARDVKIGGGASAKRGDFVGVQLTMTDAETGVEYLNTKKARRPIAFTYEKKPLLPPICEAIEDGVRTMKRGGVRRVFAPSATAFGERGVVLTDGTRVGANRDLIIDIVLEEVSPSYV
jgi:FKBP-type peptidyl-prolyl cis-trans isomerase